MHPDAKPKKRAVLAEVPLWRNQSVAPSKEVEQRIKDVLRLYNSGLGNNATARQLGLTPGQVSGIVWRARCAGVPVRKKSEPEKAGKKMRPLRPPSPPPEEPRRDPARKTIRDLVFDENVKTISEITNGFCKFPVPGAEGLRRGPCIHVFCGRSTGAITKVYCDACHEVMFDPVPKKTGGGGKAWRSKERTWAFR